MTTPAFGQVCLKCRHLRDDGSCAAFGGSIPQEISEGIVDHSEPYPGDNGIQFEPLPPGVPARTIDEMLAGVLEEISDEEKRAMLARA